MSGAASTRRACARLCLRATARFALTERHG